MKNKAQVFPLLIAVMVALLLLFASGFSHLRQSMNFPDDAELMKLLQMRDPANFWQQLGEVTGKKEVDHSLIYGAFARFNELSSTMTGDDRISVDAVRGALLTHLRHFEPALIDLKHVVANSRSVSETRKCLMIMSEIHAQTHNFSDLQKTDEQLRITGEAFRTNVPENIQEVIMRQKAYQKLHLPYYLAVWFLLLIFPAAITEIERRNWMKRFGGRDELRGPYISFMYSPMCSTLMAISGIVFLAVQIPHKLGIPGKYALLFFHVFVVWLFCQLPLFLLENHVKKVNRSLARYCFEKLTLVLLNHLSLIAVFLTFMILHFMVAGMPIWPVLRPVGATVIPPALFALWVMLLQWLFPYLFTFSRISCNSQNHRVFVAGDGFRRGIVDLGSLQKNSATIVYGGLESALSREEFALLLQRSRRKYECGWLFFDFLLIILFAMIASMLIALDPFTWASFFLTGPGFFEAVMVIGISVLCYWARKHFARTGQFSADAELAGEGKAEALIKVLEKVNALNFFPESLREGDRNEFDPMSLDEARLKLRNADGVFFPATSRPDCSVLVSLWRSRLAIDWKLGTEEAVYLTSLDYSVNAESADEELRSLACRHSRLGAECLYKHDRQELTIVFCCQKFSSFSAETPLPQQKICQICSEAMKKALQFGPFTWRNTEKGCILRCQQPD